MSAFNERFAIALTISELDASALNKKMGLAKGHLGKLLRGDNRPGLDLLNKLFDELPKVDPGWLVSGKGEALITSISTKLYPTPDVPFDVPFDVPQTKRTLPYNQDKPPKILHDATPDPWRPSIVPIVVDANNTGRIVQLDARAAAGLPQLVNEPEYYTDRPTLSLPGEQWGQHQYFAIQVDGESMHPTIFHQDYVICRRIYDPVEVRDGYVHIVVLRDGVYCKRLLNRIKQRSELVLQSDNRSYSPITAPVADLIAIFRVEMRLTFSFPNLSREVDTRLNDLEARFAAIERIITPPSKPARRPTNSPLKTT